MKVNEFVITGFLMVLCLGLTGLNVLPKLFLSSPQVVIEQSEIVVSIAGAVEKPGLYRLPWGSRLDDLIAVAGGLLEEADEHLVNLAAPLDEGESVFVPRKMTPEGEKRISLNSGSVKELESLLGIGPVMAERIVFGRPYHAFEELLRIKGIGTKTLERLRPYITL